MTSHPQNVLLVTADAALAQRMATELARGRSVPQVVVASTLARAREQLGVMPPTVIFLDGGLPGDMPRSQLAREMALHAPVVMAVNPAHNVELAPVISTGEVDCVATAGDFLPVVVALLDRRLRFEKHSMKYEEALEADEVVDFSSLLRHELNNPLTGILGNAEMLLRRRDQLPSDVLMRVETITHLTLRLRETVRRISNAWESRQQQGHQQARKQIQKLSRQETTQD